MRNHTPLHAFTLRAKSALMAVPVALALTLGVAGTVTMPTLASAQDLSEEHVRLAAQYAELSGANRLYINALTAQRRDIIRALASTNPDIGPMITEVSDLAYVEMAEETGPLFESIARVYAARYPMEDLQVIVDFFQSDVGQRFLETRRDADQEAFQATISWGDGISVAFLARVRELLAERGVEL